jgi:hypothetical protein
LIDNINKKLMQLEWIKKELKWIYYDFKQVSIIVLIQKLILYSFYSIQQQYVLRIEILKSTGANL